VENANCKSCPSFFPTRTNSQHNMHSKIVLFSQNCINSSLLLTCYNTYHITTGKVPIAPLFTALLIAYKLQVTSIFTPFTVYFISTNMHNINQAFQWCDVMCTMCCGWAVLLSFLTFDLLTKVLLALIAATTTTKYTYSIISYIKQPI